MTFLKLPATPARAPVVPTDLHEHTLSSSCACLQNKKGRERFGRCGLLNLNPGGDLRSRVVSSAVSSARQGLTSVFGMGTGVTLAVRPPGNLCIETGDRNSSDGANAAARNRNSEFR